MYLCKQYGTAIFYGLICIFLYTLSTQYAAADNLAKPVKPPLSAYQFVPRVEGKIRTSRQRTLAATEIWAPLAQQNDKIVYGSIRYMGDNYQNFEGNIGIGYRQIAFAKSHILGQRILGVHTWLDRRHTNHNSTFYQNVIGIELLSNSIDLRANAYIPLSSPKTFRTENVGSSKPYFVGHGLYYDTHGFAIEEAQHGYDFEIGKRIKFFEKYIDSFATYNGIYQFSGKHTDAIFGFRNRIEANITPSFSIGSRVQYDHVRGFQALSDITIRFPFSAKTPYKNNDLRSRLDESPERDIDIVTNTALLDDGLLKPVINQQTGELQRIIHVDNLSSSVGNGTYLYPYHTLNSMQDGIRENDIVYIHHGDGTGDYLDRGLVINTPNIRLIGAGSHLVFDQGRILDVRPEHYTSGDIIIQATKDSIISNKAFDNGDGHGLTLAASNIHVTGIDVQSSYESGIRILADGKNINNITIDRVNSAYNITNGLTIDAFNGGTVDNVTIQNSNFSNNLYGGIGLNMAGDTSSIKNIIINNNNLDKNRITGFNGNITGGTAENIQISHNSMSGNHEDGFTLNVGGTSHTAINFTDNIMRYNEMRGLALQTQDMASLHFKAERNEISYTYNPVGMSSFTMYIDHDSESTDFKVDLGGGSLGSKGYNRFENNGMYDLFLDTRPGTYPVSNPGIMLQAYYNYWGDPFGLDLASRVIYDHDWGLGHYSLIDTLYSLQQ